MAPRARLAHALLGCLLLSVGAGADARAQDGGLKGIAEGLGFAIEPPPPPPFVTDTRPTGDLPWIGVFAPPAEPSHPPLTPAQVQALKGDLEAAEKRNAALRANFPHAVEAAAARRHAKVKKKLELDAAPAGASGR